LSYLQSFPLDIVKIDRSFIVAMQTRERTSEIVALIVAMAQRLDIVTIAEGVETREQLELVLAAGCKLVQGFYFSGPRPIDQFDLCAAATEGFGRKAA
jgi:EAL domain-containing protein (putative c-di-GMP-specific phosphodiesterase class I)